MPTDQVFLQYTDIGTSLSGCMARMFTRDYTLIVSREAKKAQHWAATRPLSAIRKRSI